MHFNIPDSTPKFSGLSGTNVEHVGQPKTET